MSAESSPWVADEYEDNIASIESSHPSLTSSPSGKSSHSNLSCISVVKQKKVWRGEVESDADFREPKFSVLCSEEGVSVEMEDEISLSCLSWIPMMGSS